ncbi:DUF488 domain-containing protein [Halopiger xanaduensis]|uniref:DUF488 domain-containing protein n=1 Tax=Halopiger xanaduensis (strain DSM 18323 / JCM 14033 / SH-6) TaxID=797210 RepID=F8D3M3_HALXS|nr:DUF488 domain-containing protein [Halopiger xanaduensis]AEH37388.1 hypothetical protein Halxa_2772 [Halopiger xanaduensis SH-6]
MASESRGSDAHSESEGELADTYVAAVQHDLADLPDGAALVGVVRRPAPWFHAAVDENYPELGPPADLLESMREIEDDMKMQGLCEKGAHNAAWDQVGFDEAYRDHLETSADAQAAIEDLAERLESGESIALVCFENTEKKRCHRTILRERLAERLEAEG